MKPIPKRPYAQIHLPALTAEEAVLLAHIFDKAGAAIWRAHGEAMLEFLSWSDQPEHDDDDIPEDLPF